MTQIDGKPAAARRRGRRSAGFFWGLTLGLLGALAVVAAGDLGWGVLPALPGGGAATASPVQAETVRASAMVLFDSELPPGMRVYVDGKALESTGAGPGVPLELDPSARRLEVRGPDGPLWSTRLELQPNAADTLHPVLGGEIVVEVDRQAPSGPLFLDGRMAGTAPGTLSRVGPGWHTLSIRDGERILFEDACAVRPGEVTVVQVPPVPPRGKGRMVVRARFLSEEGLVEETGRPVWVDGENRGATPLDLTLPSGFHSVRVDRDGEPAAVEVFFLEAGRARYVNAEFGRGASLAVSVSAPAGASSRGPVAIPVRVTGDGGPLTLTDGALFVVRPGQGRPLSVPLVPSGTDPGLWVAVVPADLLETSPLTGYAQCRDEMGREGVSEIFSLELR
jgi:hypothetical protein